MAKQDVFTFTCDLRERSGTGGSRAVRREGWVPAILYGDDQAPANIKLRFNEVVAQVNKGQLIGTLSKISVDGKEQFVIGRDIQVDPIKDQPIHLDLMRVSRKTRTNVEVPVHFINEDKCKGLTAGGVLNVVRHAVEVIAPAMDIPENFEIDLEGLEIGDVIHVSKIKLPDDVELTVTDRDYTVATIAAPTVMKATEEEAEGEEGEEVAADEVPSDQKGEEESGDES